MKKFALLFIMMLMVCIAVMAQKTTPAWEELKTFHGYMAGTFHPAEEGNFAPLRAKADSMLTAAKKWEASAIPINYKPTETKETIALLVKQTTAIKSAVDSKANDAELTKLITEAHDIFHKIVGECKID